MVNTKGVNIMKKFTGKEIEIIRGEKQGQRGKYLGTDGYTGAGVICKVLIDNKPFSFRWDYFKFTDSNVQKAWNEDEELTDLDFNN